MLRSRFALAATATALLLAACAGGDGGGTTSPAPPVRPAPVPPGLIAVASSGLPDSVRADLLITGPLPGASFSRSASGGTNWGDVPAGRYTVAVRPVRTALGTWIGVPDSFEITVPSAAPVQVTATYQPAPSALAVTVSGLPANAAAAITVTPPGSGATAVSQSATLVAPVVVGQPSGPDRWQLAATAVTAEGARFDPARTALDTTVSFGDTARVAIAYQIATGSIAVAVGGLPAGLAGNVRVRGPDADSTTRVVTATSTLTGLEPGRYRVISSAVVQQGITYRPAADTLVVDVSASLTAVAAPVTYTAQVGRLVLSATGLPEGTAPALRLQGNGIDRRFTSAGTVDSLPIGSYTVSAAAVLAGDDRWAATPASRTVSITTGGSSTADFSYALASGSIAVAFTGLPAGLAGDVQLTGPANFSRTVSGADTVRGLEPGRYTLTPRVVRTADDAFGVLNGARTVDVTASAAPVAASFAWVLVPTVVDVPVSGLPSGTQAAVQLTDPSGATYNVTGSFRVVPARPGLWRLTASNVTAGGVTYAPSSRSREATVLAGDTLAFGISYTRTTGSLSVGIAGLPSGTAAAVTVSGPGGYSRAVTGSTTLPLLTPGSYTVSASAVSAGGGTYTASPTTQTVTVTASATPAEALVTYSMPGGSLTITASGLPGGSTPVFTLAGPGGASRTQNGAGTLSGLAAGSWTISASTVTAGETTYNPTPGSATRTISVGATSSVSFAYAAAPSGTNYTIRHVYLTQAIQKLDNSVALVANRAALLRVFVTASATNTARPDVRVRLFDGGTLLSTHTLSAPEAFVRTSIAEGTMSSTWNLSVPASSVRPGLRVLAELDPTQAVPDADRSDNSWPAGGSPQAITVNNVATFTVRFVPVITGTDTGRVSSGNSSSFLNTARRVFPLQNVVSSVRAPFTSTADTLKSNDSNGKWLTVLSEMNALRAADGAPSTTHYYGVVRVRYTSGIAGYGYVPGRAAIGWDYLPSGDGVAAHEWGHNFGRNHAPCGTSGDPNYPYAGGVIGGFGWNSTSNTIVQSNATDLMGYCSNTWISDYTWTAVMNYRGTGGFTAPAQAAVAGTGLLVWGRVVDGRIELEPAFRVQAPVSPAPRAATHEVQLLDEGGGALLTLPLETSLVDHAPAGQEQRQFAVVLPWSAALESRLQSIRVRDVRVPTRAALQRAAEPSGAGAPVAGALPTPRDPAAVLERSPRSLRVQWGNAAYRMAMVRDAQTGEIMGFVRRSGAAVATGGRAAEVVFSDGVRSVVRQ